MMAISVAYVSRRTDREPDSVNESLWVRNNTVYVDTRPIYKMIPVDGGDLLLGGYSDLLSISDQKVDRYLYTKKHLDSFIIGETPVNLALWNYAMFDFPTKQHFDNYYILETKENWIEFIEKLNLKTGRVFRMPTNDEWEYAARGGQKSRGYRFAGSDNADEVAIYKGVILPDSDDPSTFTHGKLKKPNELGLYDMSGGVWEMTSTPLYQTDPSFQTTYTALALQKKDGTLTEEQAKYMDVFAETVVRGGDYNSEKEECALDNISTTQPILMGLRLILEY